MAKKRKLDSISFSVRSHSGHTMAVTPTAGSKVRKLKKYITESLGVPAIRQRLLFGVCVLDGSVRFSESGVKDGDEISLVVLPLGDTLWSNRHAFFALLRLVLAYRSSSPLGLTGYWHVLEAKAQLEEGGVQYVWSIIGTFFTLLILIPTDPKSES